MRLVVTDCDHDAFAEERAVADAYGADLAFADASGAEELVEAGQGADGLIVQYAHITGDVLDRLPTVRAIGRYGVGYDSIDVPAATARGVAVFNVPDYGTESVSDHAIALALSLLREIPMLDRRSRSGGASFTMARPLRLFAGRTFGVVGCGLIGTATARKASALGFDIVVNDILADPPEPFHGYRAASFADVLSTSDVVSLHTPLTADTHHLIDAAGLALMKPGAILVNTSRGPVVDAEALADAAAAGRLRGAALDVTEPEPIPPGHPLTRLDNVILTPHIAWYSEESYGELKRRTVFNVASYLAGEEPSNLVNTEVLTRTR